MSQGSEGNSHTQRYERLRHWHVEDGPFAGFRGVELDRTQYEDRIRLELFDGGTRRLYVNLADCRLVVGEVV